MRPTPCHLAVVLALVLAVSGCSAGQKSPNASAPEKPSDRLATDVAPPGVYELPGGRTQVIGTLEHNPELEGGFWAISPRRPDMASDAQPIVISNPEIFTEPFLESLKDAYVVAEGTLSDGASIRMAGPELVADSLNRIERVRTGADGKRFLRGVPPRWARIEKPGVHTLENGQLRAVGVLSVAKSPDTSGTAGAGRVWVVLNEMPFGSGGTAEPNAVLSEADFGDASDSRWAGAYVAITGDLINTMQAPSGPIPVIRMSNAGVVTRQATTEDEVIKR